MSSTPRVKIHKTDKRSGKARNQDSSDDEVLYIGSSPCGQYRREQMSQKREDVIELDSSSDSSHFSQYNVRPSRTTKTTKKDSYAQPITFGGKKQMSKRKRERSYDDFEESARRKDQPEWTSKQACIASKSACKESPREKWITSAAASDDSSDLANNLKGEYYLSNPV